MKIIKEGIPEKRFNKIKIIQKCEECGCEYEFTEKDMQQVNKFSSVYVVNCPWCNDLYLFQWRQY